MGVVYISQIIVGDHWNAAMSYTVNPPNNLLRKKEKKKTLKQKNRQNLSEMLKYFK